MKNLGRFSMKRIQERHTDEAHSYLTSELRGENVAKLVSNEMSPSGSQVRVLDAGCGAGVLSFSLARWFGQAFGGDLEKDNIEIASVGRAQRAISNLHLLRMNGRELPFSKESFDGVIVNGVLEWAGVNDQSIDPAILQRKFLQEIYRVTKPGGVFYLAIENRLAPSHIKSDPHVRRPLLCLLPRSLANFLSQKLYGTSYQVFIYTLWQMKRLLSQVGFTQQKVFMPIPSYQYPLDFVSLDNQSETLRQLKEINKRHLQEKADEAQISQDMSKLMDKLYWRAKYGLLKATSCDLVYVSRRSF